MNNSAIEAIMIGVYTIVFMVALTVGVKLMGTINDMVEYAKQMSTVSSSGNLIETLEGAQDRIFNGAEVYSLYGQFKEGKISADIDIVVDTGARIYSIKDYGENIGLSYLDREFILKNNSKNTFLLELKPI